MILSVSERKYGFGVFEIEDWMLNSEKLSITFSSVPDAELDHEREESLFYPCIATAAIEMSDTGEIAKYLRDNQSRSQSVYWRDLPLNLADPIREKDSKLRSFIKDVVNLIDWRFPEPTQIARRDFNSLYFSQPNDKGLGKISHPLIVSFGEDDIRIFDQQKKRLSKRS